MPVIIELPCCASIISKIFITCDSEDSKEELDRVAGIYVTAYNAGPNAVIYYLEENKGWIMALSSLDFTNSGLLRVMSVLWH
jgi:hypothetical protein